MANILAITSTPDVHVEMVQEHLKDDINIFNPCLFPYDTDISYEWDGNKFLVSSNGAIYSDFDAIWYRKPKMLGSEDMQVDYEYQDFAFSAYEQAVKTLYTSLEDKLWVSDYWAIQRATRNKVFQISHAHNLGMPVPDTLVTSVPENAIAFIKKHNSVVTKALGSARVANQGLFMTTRITPDEDIDFEGLRIAPAIFQKEIASTLDIRVTVVGNNIFPCQISKKGELSSEVDWNVGTYTHDIEYGIHSEFPADLCNQCLDLVSNLGLVYGALDFVMDKNGKYWFIEINPNGQWAFVEYETGLPIAKALADLLSGS